MLLPFRDHNPSRRKPYVTYLLIAANILIFLAYWPLFNEDWRLYLFFQDWALIPVRLVNGQGYLGLVTSMFLHGGILHLAGNMLFLYIFGDNLEDTLGHLPFLAFYLVCGAGAGFTHLVMDPHSGIPLVGASGAVAGVMAGYLLLFPRARVDLFLFLIIIIRTFSLRAWIVIPGWLGIQVYYVITVGNSGSVAYWAHIGGFALGAAIVLPVWLRLGGTRFWSHSGGQPRHQESGQSSGSRIPTVVRRRRSGNRRI